MKVIDKKATMELINRLIDECALSRIDIAKRLGVKPQAVYGWRYGKFPSLNNLFNLADILGKSIDDLVILDKDILRNFYRLDV